MRCLNVPGIVSKQSVLLSGGYIYLTIIIKCHTWLMFLSCFLTVFPTKKCIFHKIFVLLKA